MEDFYYEENTKHIFLKCLIIIFILGLLVGTFIYYKKTNTLRLKKITIELGTKLSTNVKDYILNGNNIDEYKLYLDNVDQENVGTYTYKIRYNKHTKSNKVIIKDTTKPIVELNDITLKLGDKLNKEELITKCEDLSLPCTITLKDENILTKLNNIGTYTINFTVSDAHNNTIKEKINVTVKNDTETSSNLSSDLEYASNSKNDDTIEHIFFKKFDKAIEQDTTEFENIFQNISSLDFSEYTEGDIYKAELIIAYNKYKYIIGIQVLVTFNDGTTKLLES